MTAIDLAPSVTVEVHLPAAARSRALVAETAEGLAARPRELSPTWLYDDRGCDLFEQITHLPEYYPTRAERAILTQQAADVATLTGADTLVELGAGTSEKTRLLLDAMASTGRLRRFAPFDVAEPALRATAQAVAREYPGVEITAVVGDLRRHLEVIPGGGRRLVALLGGTVGNLEPPERAALLHGLAEAMNPGDALLLGTDLVKDRDRLVAAYDDAAGVTAAFNLNILQVLNRELEADFDPIRFRHVVRFDEEHSWIEMLLRSRSDQIVHLGKVGIVLALRAGEDIRTEVSTKFTAAGVASEIAVAGLELAAWWTDPAGDYGLSLSLR